MTLTQSRVLQYIGIILICGILAGGYWYFHSQASTLNAPGGDPLSKGLVGYWKLDDGSGTTAIDSSTNGNNGTLTNGPTWTTGQIGAAVSFDGTDDYVNVGSSPGLTAAPLTMCVWIYPTDVSTNYRIPLSMTDTNSTMNGWYIAVGSGGSVSFVVAQNDTYTSAQATVTLTTSTWYHICGVESSSSSRSIYVNGVLSGTDTTSKTPAAGNGKFTQIGRWASQGNKQFQGFIDEVRVYNRALSADEISKLYNLTSPTGVDASLDAYWSFDGSNVSGTTLYDQSGREKNGTLMNGVQVTQGKIGQALFFDGVDDRVNVATVATGTTFTITAWVRPQPGGPSYGQFFGENQDSCFEFHNANNKLTFNSGGSYNDSNTALPDNEWSFVGISVTAGSGTFYLNGNPDGTKTGISSHNYVDIGWNVGGEYFHGKIDELRFYGRALSQSEMQSLYQQGGVAKFNSSISQPQGTGKIFSGLVDYWRFDDGSGTTATDSGTGAHNGTLTGGGFTWGTGQVNGGLDTTGAGYISTADTSLANNSFTLSAWAKRTTSGTYDYIFAQGTPSANNALQFGFRDSNVFMCAFYNNDLDTTGTYTDTNWHYWTCTYDAVSNLRSIYLDGVFLKSDTASADYQGSGAQQIGASFAGSLDEFRIYSRALSADEVRQIYNLTNPANLDSSLKGYWSFNGTDISGTTAYDRSGNGNNGTLTNGPTAVSGKVGQALNFDGSDDYVNLGTGSAIRFTTNGSISAWIKTGAAPSGYRVIIGGDGETETGYSFALNTGNLKFRINKDDFHTIQTAWTGVYDDNNFHLITVTKAGATAILYVDGLQKASIGSMGSATWSTQPVYIGNEYNRSYNFPGSIDEVRVYNRALSASEIQTLYVQGAGDKVNSSISQPQGTGRLDSGLAGYWKLDDGSGTTATDSSTNGNNGTLTNGPTWTTGQIGGAVNFDGSNDYIVGANSISVANISFSIAAWAKRTSTGSYDIIFGNGTYSGTDTVLQFGFTNNDYFMCSFFGDDLNTSSTYTDSNWHHWACTYDASSKLRAIYRDGVLVRSATAGGNYTGSGVPYIGDDSGVGSAGSFSGQLDEVRIYNRPLSTDEVRQLYNLTAPTGVDTSLKGYWSFNGQDISGTTAYDRSGAGNNGTLTNGPTAVPGKIGQALSFDGTNDYVNLGTTIAYAKNASLISMSAWVKPRSFVDYGDIFTESISTNTDWRFGCGFRSSGKPYCGGRSPDSGTFQEWRGNTALSTGNWYHFIAVIDVGNDAVTIYINGVAQVNEATGNFTNSIFDNTSPVAIHLGGLGSPYLFSGSIDEVRIYNRALSASEVAALYNQGR